MNITAFGPVTGEDGQRWCCGLSCGAPCPYKLKFKPPAQRKFTGTEWCGTCGWLEGCTCGFRESLST